MESVAIIGTGIAGMGAAYFLRGRYDITLYEKNDYPGGHTNTLTVPEGGKDIFIDSAFMVYNEATYPNLTRLFKELNVETKPASMSFSVQHLPSGLEYRGTGINNLFLQKKNIFSHRFIRMLLDIDRFSRQSAEVLTEKKYAVYTLSQYVREKEFGKDFLEKFLVPMSSAIWSTDRGAMLDFPVMTLVRFFKNHGFLGLRTQHQWRTVEGGSRMYRDKILAYFHGKVLLNNRVERIVRQNDNVQVRDKNGNEKLYDKVVVACHADQALALLGDPTPFEEKLLREFRYQKNKATLHTDGSIMPGIRRGWSSWNYRIKKDKSGNLKATTVYYMNSLQGVSKEKDYFVSINDPGDVDPGSILWETDYEHPVYSLAAIRAQEELPKLNHSGRTFFCGSYFRYGFHEDALVSALNAARVMTGERIWE